MKATETDRSAQQLPPSGLISIDPNSVGFAEYVAFEENLPMEESPLRSKSLMAVAVATGAQIGRIAGPALGDKVSKLIGA